MRFKTKWYECIGCGKTYPCFLSRRLLHKPSNCVCEYKNKAVWVKIKPDRKEKAK